MVLDTKTYWLTDRQSQCDFDFDFDEAVSSQFSDSSWSEFTEQYSAVYLRLFKCLSDSETESAKTTADRL
jgi:hypothetical protein